MDVQWQEEQKEIKHLLDRAKTILSEVERFEEQVSRLAGTYSPHPSNVGAMAVSTLKSALNGEVKSLEKAVTKLEESREGAHAPQVSINPNLPHYETVWNLAKGLHDVVVFFRYMSREPQTGKTLLAPGTHLSRTRGYTASRQKRSSLIDIVANGGQSWFKICGMTNKQFRWDMTKLGLDVEDSEEDSDDDSNDQAHREAYHELPLYQLAEGLAESARVYYIRNKHPKVHLFLPRMVKGEDKDIDLVLGEIDKLGIEVSCSSDLPQDVPALTADILDNMAPSPLLSLSEVLNVDTSILFSLASDFCHFRVANQPWFDGNHYFSYVTEQEKPVLLTWIYPAVGKHRLTCTKEAAEKCRITTETLGTETEKARLTILLCDDPGVDREELLQKFKLLSVHEVPPDLQLPVHVVDSSAHPTELPAAARKVIRCISDPAPTEAVFRHGWVTGKTTLTSNGLACKVLTKKLEGLGESYGGDWPSVWVCPRSCALHGTPSSTHSESPGAKSELLEKKIE